MYAILEIAGQQFKVQKDRKVYVHRLENAEGDQIVFDQIFLTENEGDIKIGSPIVKGASVTAKVLAHVRGDKVLVFHKKRRKGYRKLNGHRQNFTQILIEDIKF
jgi:large subunit ribosomal protein L21